MTYRIIAARTGQGIKQGNFANQLGITPQYLRLIEKGAVEPRRDLMIKISELLNVSVQELFFSDEE